jgi:Flp pilus assembly protein TadD
MKLATISAAALALALSACASTDTTDSAKGASASTRTATAETYTGSRIPSKTTEKHVRSTQTDKADEPVRSLGNVVGQRGG